MRRYGAAFFILLFVSVALPIAAGADTASDQQAALQSQLDQINAQIKQNQANLSQLQSQRTSLERDVAILDSRIQEAQLEIKQRNLTIKQIRNGIQEKQTGIDGLDTQVAQGEQSLAQILRETNQIDNTSLVEFVLGGSSLTDIFQEVADFHVIQQALGTSFTVMAAQRSDLASRKAALESQEQEESDLLQVQVAQQNSLKAIEKQKQDLVVAARGQESIYQQVIANQQKTAAQIESALFTLRDTSSVSFGNMYMYAQQASQATGVAPAFILGILSEESDLGQNVGSCTYHQAMNPKRDVPVFLALMSELGLNPESQKVSCAPSYGYGGAMGPAQFIPSTWQLYQDRIASKTGQNPPNPWDPRTAVFATAIYMSDLGADQGTASAQRTAALKYFAGSHWRNPSYAFYGNDVMCLTQKMQQNIDILEGRQTSGSPTSC